MRMPKPPSRPASPPKRPKQVAQDQAAAAEQKRIEAEKSAPDSKVAAVTPTANSETPNLAAVNTGTPQTEVNKSVQAELRRVGCLSAEADGNWNTTSQRSLTLFNRYAKTKFDTKLASTDALDTIKLKTARVCPMVCEHGYKADGDRCTRISCAAGSFLNDDNECEKRREKRPVARRDRPERQLAPEARQVPRAKQAIAGRSQTPTGAGLGSRGQPLTGTERERGL